MSTTDGLGRRAIVIGSGIAGLVSAKVLSKYFAEVYLYERDEIPEHPRPRRYVPQGNHFHGLLPGGFDALAEVFPGFHEDLVAAGSQVAGPRDIYFYLPEGKSYSFTGYHPEPLSEAIAKPIYVQSRPLLEHCIRKRVESTKNIVSFHGCLIEACHAQDGSVKGIVGADDEIVEADLVLDATGKQTRTLKWLTDLGYDRPRESVVHCDFAYTSVFMRSHDPRAFEGVAFFVVPNGGGAGDLRRGGGLVRIEDDLWLLISVGRFGDYPPKNMTGLLEFVRSLPEPRLSELMLTADPVAELAHFRFPKSTRRHFQELRAFPDGLLPIGDAVCHYNPMYGQGMSAACRQALVLDKLLAQRVSNKCGLYRLYQDFFPGVYEETRAPWLLAALADFQIPKCTGDFPYEESEAMAKFEALHGMMDYGSEDVVVALNDVYTMQKPLASLIEFNPKKA